jgi:hypothetical protein
MARTGEAAFAKFSNDEKVIALGQVLDVATPNEAGTFLAKLPAGASCAVQRWRTASSQA